MVRWVWDLGEGGVDSDTDTCINVVKFNATQSSRKLCVSTCAKQPLPGNRSTHLLIASGPITQTTLGKPCCG